MTRNPLALAIILSSTLAGFAADTTLHTFKKIQLSDQFYGEGANFGDFNKDGKMDVVSGPFWYEGPDFQKKHEYYPAKPFDPANYSDNFFAFTHDFNKDGYDDILIYGFPGLDASWFQNPGKAGLNSTNHWTRHKVFPVVDNESPTWGDLTGDGKPEIIFHSGGHLGYATPDWSDPTKPWTFHKISPKGNYQRFTHGLGYGDVNGDGKLDLLEANGWWEQPKSLKDDPEWTFHKFQFGVGGAHMYAYDVNGDGLNDVITSLAAHGYGLAWYEQVKENGAITFREHIIMNKEPNENRYGLKFSQLHAIDLIDMDGDGIKDLVTGKRYWAHGPKGDAEPGAPAVLYWFKLVRNGKQVDFVPHQIDDNSGVGVQVVAAKSTNPKYPDIVVGNKKDTSALLPNPKKANRQEWEQAQPKPVEQK